MDHECEAEDAPAALLPNGNVLMALGPVTANGGTVISWWSRP